MSYNNSLENFIINDIEYDGYESLDDENTELYDENTECEYYYGKNKLRNKFYEYYSDISEFDENNCLYLSLNIYNNIITKEYDMDVINLTDYQLKNSKLGCVFKLGSTSTKYNNFFKRCEQELSSNKSLLFTIPIMIMQGDNVRTIESEIHNILNELKLKIFMNKNCKLYSPSEIYEISDKIKDWILDYAENSKLECIYNVAVKQNETWYDIIPNKIQKILKKMFSDKELEMIERCDNLTDSKKRKYREYF